MKLVTIIVVCIAVMATVLLLIPTRTVSYERVKPAKEIALERCLELIAPDATSLCYP